MPEAPTLPTPEVVFFDVGDTLVRAHPSWAEIYLSAMRDFGIVVTTEQLERALLDNMGMPAWGDAGPFEATEEAAWRRIHEYDAAVMASLGHHDLPLAFYQRISSGFTERTAWHIYPDVHPALDALQAAGVRAAVISNWMWNGPELLHRLDLAPHFETLVISARLGYQKPHPRIFQHALEVMQVEPSRSVHVGDSYRADVEGARGVGIQPVLIAREERRIGAHLAPESPDAPVISDLLELLRLIGVEVAAT